jgi:hypothetical protein
MLNAQSHITAASGTVLDAPYPAMCALIPHGRSTAVRSGPIALTCGLVDGMSLEETHARHNRSRNLPPAAPDATAVLGRGLMCRYLRMGRRSTALFGAYVLGPACCRRRGVVGHAA